MAVQILEERTHKYGRNVMATAGVILVLAWVPGIEISAFEPFGFVIGDAPGGELSIWWLLGGVLVYYFVRFLVSLGIDVLEKRDSIATRYHQLRDDKFAVDSLDTGKGARKQAQTRIWLFPPNLVAEWQFLILEAGMPIVLFSFAAFAAYVEIGSLWHCSAGCVAFLR